MMANRSFDHMLGALHVQNPAIDGLTGNETNPDTTGTPVMVSPNAAYQSQLDPDPDHHFHAGLWYRTARIHGQLRAVRNVCQ